VHVLNSFGHFILQACYLLRAALIWLVLHRHSLDGTISPLRHSWPSNLIFFYLIRPNFNGMIPQPFSIASESSRRHLNCFIAIWWQTNKQTSQRLPLKQHFTGYRFGETTKRCNRILQFVETAYTHDVVFTRELTEISLYEFSVGHQNLLYRLQTKQPPHCYFPCTK